MEDVLGPTPGTPPANESTAHPARAWATAGSARPEERLARLPAGEVEGTARHPMNTADRDAYLAAIRPYGSIARRTHDAPIALVSIGDLHAIQGTVNRERLAMHLADPRMNDGRRAAGHGGLIDRPVVVKLGGAMYLHDGHHRVTAAHLRGQDSVKVRLVDLDPT